MEADETLAIGQQAVEGVASVVARDAISVVLVQANEISRVLAKRLFNHIDADAAKEIAAVASTIYF